MYRRSYLVFIMVPRNRMELVLQGVTLLELQSRSRSRGKAFKLSSNLSPKRDCSAVLNTTLDGNVTSTWYKISLRSARC